MPVQLDKIECSFCKEYFRPKTRARKKYCSDKCTDDAGNAKKRIRREGLRKNIEILKSFGIPLNSSILSSQKELEAKGFKAEFNSRYMEIWSEQDNAKAYRVYFDTYVVVNQGGKITIYNF